MDERHNRYEERAEWQEKLRLTEKEATDRALVLADVENKHRLDELNNLRREYTHDRGGFVTIAQLTTVVDTQNERYGLVLAALADLKAAIGSNVSSRAGLIQGLGYIFGVVGVLIAIASYLVNH
jgi:hypothetical protein